MKHAHFRVVVVNQGHLRLHSYSDQVNVAVRAQCLVLEEVRLLQFVVHAIVVTRKWIVSTNAVPASAKAGVSVTSVTAHIRASQGDALDILHHCTGDGVAHVFVAFRVSATEPLGAPLAHASE